jgi:hypothetical protein
VNFTGYLIFKNETNRYLFWIIFAFVKTSLQDLFGKWKTISDVAALVKSPVEINRRNGNTCRKLIKELY